MGYRLSQIFWGLLIAILDIGFNEFDILVDGAGWILVGLGCHGLVGTSRRFATASSLSFLLAGLWLVSLALLSFGHTILDLIDLLVECAMYWTLLGGVIELAALHDRPDLSTIAARRRYALVLLLIVSSILGFVAGPAENYLSGWLGATLAITMIVVLVV